MNLFLAFFLLTKSAHNIPWKNETDSLNEISKKQKGKEKSLRIHKKWIFPSIHFACLSNLQIEEIHKNRMHSYLYFNSNSVYTKTYSYLNVHPWIYIFLYNDIISAKKIYKSPCRKLLACCEICVCYSDTICRCSSLSFGLDVFSQTNLPWYKDEQNKVPLIRDFVSLKDTLLLRVRFSFDAQLLWPEAEFTKCQERNASKDFRLRVSVI